MCKRIEYRGRTKTVKEWANELKIPITTIYRRLKLGWPPELVLSSYNFNYCNSTNAAFIVRSRITDIEMYPSTITPQSTRICCSVNSRCHFALQLNNWRDIQSNPANANYYCLHLDKFVVGKNPEC